MWGKLIKLNECFLLCSALRFIRLWAFSREVDTLFSAPGYMKFTFRVIDGEQNTLSKAVGRMLFICFVISVDNSYCFLHYLATCMGRHFYTPNMTHIYFGQIVRLNVRKQDLTVRRDICRMNRCEGLP